MNDDTYNMMSHKAPKSPRKGDNQAAKIAAVAGGAAIVGAGGAYAATHIPGEEEPVNKGEEQKVEEPKTEEHHEPTTVVEHHYHAAPVHVVEHTDLAEEPQIDSIIDTIDDEDVTMTQGNEPGIPLNTVNMTPPNIFGTEPVTIVDPGNEPGVDPGNEPGVDPGNEPGVDPGNEPGADPFGPIAIPTIIDEPEPEPDDIPDCVYAGPDPSYDTWEEDIIMPGDEDDIDIDAETDIVDF